MKIVYCTDTICYPGGIQRVTIAKANALADIAGNEVWIVVTDNKLPTPVLAVSEKVSVVDLGIDYYANDWKSWWYVFEGILIKRKRHRRKLERFLNQINPDVVISTGTSEKYFLPRLNVASSPARVREIHFSKDYRRRAAQGWFEKTLAILGDFADYHIHIWRYDRIVLLTEEDKRLHWSSDNRISVIPNPVVFSCPSSPSSLQNKTAIAVGRLVYQKNFESLIRAWAFVQQQHDDWCLEIWGDGELRRDLQEQINRNHLEKTVFLKGYTDNLFSKYADASFLVCSSLFEGLPLMMIEAMSCGLPNVSYACPCGPRDIIREGENGYLVQTGDEMMLAERICRLIEDHNLRQKMGASARESAKDYAIERIAKLWMNLFVSLCKKN